MKIAVLHGQMHKGSTYNITRQFIDKLKMENADIAEYFLPKDGPEFCAGCFSCFIKGEDHCPHSAAVQNIARDIEEADLIILNSPCYVFGMSGQMKTFLDHMAYRWMSHRPHPEMFKKTGLVISTAAGAGSKKVTKALKENLFYWGVPKVYCYGKSVGAADWDTVKPEKKDEIQRNVDSLALKISGGIGNAKPGIKSRIVFKVMKMNQKANNWNPLDKEHWESNGWLSGKSPW